MTPLTVIPGLPPEAIEPLTLCGIGSVELLAGIPPGEIHRVLELTAWKKGRLNRAPALETVEHWASLARQAAAAAEAIPEAIAVPRAPLAARQGYVSPAQRARLAAAGPPNPAAPPAPFPTEAPAARPLPVAAPREAPPIPEAVPMAAELAGSGFGNFEDFQAGLSRVAPLSRYALDAPGEHPHLDRLSAHESLSRWVRRGVVHPNPGLLIFGAMVVLLWRVALLAAVLAVPWLVLAVPKPSDYTPHIVVAAGILAVLGVTHLIVGSRARCRICSCHLFYSRNCVKNPKAHSLPGLGKTASLALHLLLFQWFRCMYCGTAIRLWANPHER